MIPTETIPQADGWTRYVFASLVGSVYVDVGPDGRIEANSALGYSGSPENRRRILAAAIRSVQLLRKQEEGEQ